LAWRLLSDVVGGSTPREDDHPLLYAQPDKHAFVPDPSLFTATSTPRARTRRACYIDAGSGGLLLKEDLFRGEIAKDVGRDALAGAYLKERAFDPSFAFEQTVRFDERMLVPWLALRAWIPGRIDRLLVELGEGN